MTKKTFLTLLCSFVFALVLAGPEKLDPLLRLLAPPAPEPPPLSLERLGVETQQEVRVLVKTQDFGGGWQLPGFSPTWVAGQFAAGTLSLDALPALAHHPQLVYLQVVRPTRPCLDVSVPEVGAPTVWQGLGGSRGGGVIVGIVDSGIDPFHPTFRVDRDGDGFEEGSRILFLWDQNLPSDGSALAYGFNYGRVFTQGEIEAALAAGYFPSTDTMGHGTHVAGIAAGDGSGGGLPGVAPEANLIVVNTTFYEDGVLEGTAFVLERAWELGLPAVVNLSLGTHAGPHDATSLFEQALDALVDRPGRAVVVAAGNEAQEKIHVGAEVHGPITWHLIPQTAWLSASFWHQATCAFRIEVAAPSGEELVVLPGGQGYLSTPVGQVWVDNASGGVPDPRNGDLEIYLTITGATAGSRWQLTLDPVGAGGRVDGWVEDSRAGYFLEGDSEMTIAEPGNAQRVITVGAYVTKNRWISVVGEQTYEGVVGELAAFSSHGPTRDGRIKPELCAPGAWIASARSQAASVADWTLLPGGDYFMLLGTSMAAPHVTGGAALILSLEPGLAWDELREALMQGARVDQWVGAVPNVTWGWGKLSLPGAVEALGPSPGPEAPILLLLGSPVAREARFWYQLPQEASWAELRIYDLTGRLLWRARVAGEPRGELRWPLITTGGNPVASGLYLAVLVSEGTSSPIVRVVVQR